MKKFTENINNEVTGSRDVNGNWVNETPQAKLRNQLGPFWTLSSIIIDHPEFLQTEEYEKVVKDPTSTPEQRGSAYAKYLNAGRD